MILLVDEGLLKGDATDSIGKSKQWLKSELEQLGYVDLKELIYCEWSSTEGFFIIHKDTLVFYEKLFAI